MKKKLFWLFIAILCIFFACLCTNYDYDFFARLIVGERIIENGIMPLKDFLSYTPTHTWYDHEWGSSVVFYGILKYFNAFGILIFYALMFWGITFFVIKTQRLQKKAYPTSIIFTVIFMMLFARLNHSLVRCHLFTFFFFSVFLYLLERERKQPSKLIWLILPMTIIWNNLHGGVVAGLGLILMYVVGEFLNKKPWKKFLKVLCCSAPLLIINPYGIKYLNFLFSATTKNRKYISEWWPFYRKRYFFYYMFPSLFIIFGMVVAFVNQFRTKKIDYTKIIVVGVAVLEGLWHIKLLSLGLIAVSSLCYNEIFGLFVKFKKILKPIERSVYAVIILLGLAIPLFSPAVPRADFQAFPLYEVEFLKLNNIKGNIVVPFGCGSYISYKLYPDNLIYMDGRYEEVYYDKEFNALRDFELVEENWDDIIKNYDTEILMPKKTSLVYKFLINNDDWIHLFDGRICGIFVKKGDVKFSYIEPDYGIDYYRRTMFKSTNFGKNLRGK